MKPVFPQGEQLDLFAAEDSAGVAEGSTAEIRTILVDTTEALSDLVGVLQDADRIAFDTETTDVDVMRAKLVGISLAVNPDEGYYIPLGHQNGQQLDTYEVLKALTKPMSDPSIEKVGHNLKYDYLILKRAGLTVSPLSFDTMIAEWLINPSSRNLGLKSLAWVRLGYEMTQIEALIGKGRNQKTMDQVSIAEASKYAAADAAICLQLMSQLQEELAAA